MVLCISPLAADGGAADSDHSAITCRHKILPFPPFSASSPNGVKVDTQLVGLAEGRAISCLS